MLIRFMMLYRKNDAPLDFDFAKVTERAKENPVFYVQYAPRAAIWLSGEAPEQLGRGLDGQPWLGLRATWRCCPMDECELAPDRASSRRIPALDRMSRRQTLSRTDWLFTSMIWPAAFHYAQWNRGNDNTDLRFVKVTD